MEVGQEGNQEAPFFRVSCEDADTEGLQRMTDATERVFDHRVVKERKERHGTNRF